MSRICASTISLETSELHSIPGAPPDLVDPPPGCRFAARCPEVMERCTEVVPRLAEVSREQQAACILHPGADPGTAATREGAGTDEVWEGAR